MGNMPVAITYGETATQLHMDAVSFGHFQDIVAIATEHNVEPLSAEQAARLVSVMVVRALAGVNTEVALHEQMIRGSSDAFVRRVRETGKMLVYCAAEFEEDDQALVFFNPSS